MKMKFMTNVLIGATLLSLLATSAAAIDLQERYPTQLTTGDDRPDRARPWEFSEKDIFHVSKFEFKIGDKLKVETGSADLGVGHCIDGAVWAVLIPRGQGTLISPAVGAEENVANVWLRFHPLEINRIFSPDTVFTDGNSNLVTQTRDIARTKIGSSWQAGGKAMISDPKDMTVYIDTKNGHGRFFIVDTQAQTAKYIAAFDRQSSNEISATTFPPVVAKTVPESGTENVPPGEFEIKITFSKEMRDHSWSWSSAWENSTPDFIGAPQYDPAHKICSVKVKLEPNKTYGFWLNSQDFHNFKDAQGHAAVPYLLVFQTKSQ